jgi:hypothetical protein
MAKRSEKPKKSQNNSRRGLSKRAAATAGGGEAPLSLALTQVTQTGVGAARLCAFAVDPLEPWLSSEHLECSECLAKQLIGFAFSALPD